MRLSLSWVPWIGLCALAGACGTADSVVTSNGGAGGFITGASSSANTASSSSSSSAAGGGNDGGNGGGSSATGGTGGDISQGGSGGTPQPCNDIGVGEPNESEPNALDMGTQSDCASAKSIAGTIGNNDVDWFLYEGNDALCVVNPERSFSHAGGLELCKFFECTSGQGDTEVTCPSSATPAISPGGRPGCCSSAGFKVSDLNCKGTIDDDVFVFLRVQATAPASSTCIDYNIQYNF